MSEETWLDSSEALEKGFVDTIKLTSNKKQKEEMKNALYNIAMQIQPKTNKMKKVINHFGLNEDASEKEILTKISELENSVKDLNESNTDLIAKNTADLEAQKVELEKVSSDLAEKVIKANKELASTLIDSAIAAGKIKKEAKTDLLEKAENNLDLVKTILDSIETPKIKLSDFVENTSTEIKESFRELEKNDPKKLAKIKAENITLYKQLYEAEYNNK